mmetsp:Transcript_83160/g.233001  ORF Transcript_83160/g.233001 Transcript_83160/m.233001 type:complete len:217 (-) Transcript_83160:511-1161(-)
MQHKPTFLLPLNASSPSVSWSQTSLEDPSQPEVRAMWKPPPRFSCKEHTWAPRAVQVRAASGKRHCRQPKNIESELAAPTRLGKSMARNSSGEMSLSYQRKSSMKALVPARQGSRPMCKSPVTLGTGPSKMTSLSRMPFMYKRSTLPARMAATCVHRRIGSKPFASSAPSPPSVRAVTRRCKRRSFGARSRAGCNSSAREPRLKMVRQLPMESSMR